MSEAPFVRSPYNYDMNIAGDESGLNCKDKSLTVQDQRGETDINTIVKRFGLTGELPTAVRLPEDGDFTNVGTYQEALNAILAAEATFMEFPPDVRSRFDNDAGKFVDFFARPENRDEAKKLGFLVPDKVDPAVRLSQESIDALRADPKN